jgi:hypothetical protein
MLLFYSYMSKRGKAGGIPHLSATDIANVLVKGFGQGIGITRPGAGNQQFFQNLSNKWVTSKKGSTSNVLDESYCNDAADEWWRWAMTNPIDVSPFYGQIRPGLFVPYLFKESSSKIYMIGVSAFRTPDIIRVALTERVPLLIPIYNVIAAKEEYPRADRGKIDLKSIVIDDLRGLYALKATYDRQPIEGCAVIRDKPFKIEYVPRDNVMGIPEDRLGGENTINVSHGGFYIMLNPQSKAMARGDHLLWFEAKSVNYEIEAKVHISVLN